jgi:hypothetical protein
MQTQATTRFHGNVPASWPKRAGASPRGARPAGRGNLGELERFVDLCHEYEVPYRLGDIEENRHQRPPRRRFLGRQRSGIVLCRAPFTEGVVFLDARVDDLRHRRLFETMPAGNGSRGAPRRPVSSAISRS